MIGYLRGVLHAISPEKVVLDVGGVGYAVRTPLSTYYELERLGSGAEAELLIHTEVRENALELFGFLTDEERTLFERLIGVSGIGPRLAQVILSGMAPSEVVDALAAGDATRLVRIPGVGKKTAERMVLELRDKARELQTESVGEIARAASDDFDLVQALVGLGYRLVPVERTVQQVRQENPEAAFGELLRLCLRKLSKL